MSREIGKTTQKSWQEFYEEPLEVQRMLAWATTHSPLLDALADARSVLEVGTGTSVLAIVQSLLGKRSVSLDLEAAVQLVASTNVERLNGEVGFVTGDAFTMPFGPGEFDAAFSQGFFEHFADNEIRRLIEEQLRVASRVVFSVPNRWYPHLGRRGPGLIGNERLLSRRQWLQILAPYHPQVTEYRDPKALSIAGKALSPRMHTLVVIDT